MSGWLLLPQQGLCGKLWGPVRQQLGQDSIAGLHNSARLSVIDWLVSSKCVPGADAGHQEGVCGGQD